MRKIIAPLQEPVVFYILDAVKEITHDHQLAGFKELDAVYQPLHVFFSNRSRDGDPAFAEVACFADVQVRQDEYLLLLPENSPAAMQDEIVIADCMFY